MRGESELFFFVFYGCSFAHQLTNKAKLERFFIVTNKGNNLTSILLVASLVASWLCELVYVSGIIQFPTEPTGGTVELRRGPCLTHFGNLKSFTTQ